MVCLECVQPGTVGPAGWILAHFKLVLLVAGHIQPGRMSTDGVQVQSDRRQMPEYFALKELSSNKLFRPGKDTNLKEYLPLNEPSIQQYMKHEAIVETYWADVRCLDPKTGRPLDIAAGALNNWTSLDNIADIEATYTATADHTQQPNMPEAVKLQMRIAMEHCDLGATPHSLFIALGGTRAFSAILLQSGPQYTVLSTQSRPRASNKVLVSMTCPLSGQLISLTVAPIVSVFNGCCPFLCRKTAVQHRQSIHSSKKLKMSNWYLRWGSEHYCYMHLPSVCQFHAPWLRAIFVMQHQIMFLSPVQLALAGELDKDFSVLSEGAIGRAFIDSTVI